MRYLLLVFYFFLSTALSEPTAVRYGGDACKLLYMINYLIETAKESGIGKTEFLQQVDQSKESIEIKVLIHLEAEMIYKLPKGANIAQSIKQQCIYPGYISRTAI